MVITFVGFIVAASLGAFLRYQSALFFHPPWGTLLVNVLGSLLIGFLAVTLDKYSPAARTLILVALLGSLTTFSTYSLELVQLFHEGFIGRALLYFVSANFLCFAACLLGFKVAQALMVSQ